LILLGEYYKEIQFPYKEHFNYYYPSQINWLNDSIIYFVYFLLMDENYFVKMNINTGDTKSVFNLNTYQYRKNDTVAFVVDGYYYNPQNNNIIFVL
jgi:hypothetical protein